MTRSAQVKDERWFWLTLRRALLMSVKAIEARYGKDEASREG